METNLQILVVFLNVKRKSKNLNQLRWFLGNIMKTGIFVFLFITCLISTVSRNKHTLRHFYRLFTNFNRNLFLRFYHHQLCFFVIPFFIKIFFLQISLRKIWQNLRVVILSKRKQIKQKVDNNTLRPVKGTFLLLISCLLNTNG